MDLVMQNNAEAGPPSDEEPLTAMDIYRLQSSLEVSPPSWLDSERFLECMQNLRLKNPTGAPPRYKFRDADLDVTLLKYDLKFASDVTINPDAIGLLNDKIKFNNLCGKTLMVTLSREIFTVLDSRPIPEALPHMLKCAVRALLHENVEIFAGEHSIAVYKNRAAHETNTLIREACPLVETLNRAEVRLIAEMDPQVTGSAKPPITPRDLFPFYDSRRRKLLPVFMLKQMGLDISIPFEEVMDRGRCRTRGTYT